MIPGGGGVGGDTQRILANGTISKNAPLLVDLSSDADEASAID